MIFLIFGGSASGKKEYAEKCLSAALSEAKAAAYKSPESESDQPFCLVEGLEQWLDVQPCADDCVVLQQLAEKVEDAEKRAGSRPLVLLFEERGCGIVPLDKELRALRERNGKALRWLAQRAERVDRVFAGQGLCLKGAEVKLFAETDGTSQAATALMSTKESSFSEISDVARGSLSAASNECRRFILKLYRHGASEPNLRKEYLGRRDCLLAMKGREALLRRREKERQNLPLTLLFSSPAKRCLETAAVYFPEFYPLLIPDFWERDFGGLEGKTWEEMKDDADYRSWIASSGQSAPFHMEPAEAFAARISAGFEKVLSCIDISLSASQGSGVSGSDPARFAIVMHGGSIMELLHQLAERFPELVDTKLEGGAPCQDSPAYYHFMLKEGESLTLLGELSFGRLISCRLLEGKGE